MGTTCEHMIFYYMLMIKTLSENTEKECLIIQDHP